MYRTCTYCYRDLGTNEIVASFPVGRRLAFDQQKGRLWVVCRRCRRWNLSPVEERWEAIEECERQFHDTPNKYSTDNIGLARLTDGSDLIRVGMPRREEFAAWRYGPILVRRRAVATAGSLVTGLALWGSAPTVLPWLLPPLFAGLKRRIVARLPAPGGTVARIRQSDLSWLRFAKSKHGNGFTLLLSYAQLQVPWWRSVLRQHQERRILRLEEPDATRVAGLLLPRLNPRGGSKREVHEAVTHIEEAGDAVSLLSMVPDRWPRHTRVASMATPLRLALEMAAHEESEQRALEGQLLELETAWREAEEIAAIADRLFVPPAIEAWITKHRAARS